MHALTQRRCQLLSTRSLAKMMFLSSSYLRAVHKVPLVLARPVLPSHPNTKESVLQSHDSYSTRSLYNKPVLETPQMYCIISQGRKKKVNLTMSPFGPAGPAGPGGPSVPCEEKHRHGELAWLGCSRYFKIKFWFSKQTTDGKQELCLASARFPSGLAYNQHTELLRVRVHRPQRTFTTLLTQLMYECVLMLS